MPQRRIGILSQLVPPKPHWTAEDVPDQTGKVALITGGHRDVGREIARVLLWKGAKVYIASPSADRKHAEIDGLKVETGKDSIFFLNLDLGNLDSIKTAVEEFLARETQLHALYNNASVSSRSTDTETAQGYGVHFGTNVLGHFYLTKLLLPVLTATAKASPPRTVRVINSSSIVHYMAAREGIRWSTINNGDDAPAARRKLGIVRLNGQSRLGTILFSNELARRYGEEGIVSISLYPGTMNAGFSGANSVTTLLTRIQRLVGACICFILAGGDLEALTEDVRFVDTERPSERRTDSPGGNSNPVGLANDDPLAAIASPVADDYLTEYYDSGASYRAITSLYAGTEPMAGNFNGRYLTAWARISLPHRKALNPDLGLKLWDWCERQVRDEEQVEEGVPVKEEEPVKEKESVKEKEQAKDEDVKGKE